MVRHQISRRDFITGGGMLVIGFSLAGPLAATAAQAAVRTGKSASLEQVDAFLAIGQDGRVTIYTGKVDLGTGTRVALVQMAAEELEVSLAKTTLVEGDTDLTPDQGPTWGSLSIQIAGVQIRQAAATARRALLERAAQHLGVATDQLVVRDGVVTVKGKAAKTVSYGELIGGNQFQLAVDKQVALKNPGAHTLVGKPIKRPDIPAKVTGELTYMQDVRVPGMLHGRVVRPAAIGATLEEVDEGSVKGIPGLVKVVRQQNFLGVVATTEWAAIQAAEKLTARWSSWEELPEMEKLEQHIRQTPVIKDAVILDTGDPKQAMMSAAKTLSATYEFPMQTHGSMGPSCAIADVRDGKATVWSASQGPHLLRQELARLFDMPAENIRVLYHDGAGCYGRNGHEDAAADAFLMSSAVGRPVRVQWSRADEHGWDPKGPPVLVDLRAGLDRDGHLVAWEGEFFTPANHGTLADVVDYPLIAPSLSGHQKRSVVIWGRNTANAAPTYTLANARVVAHMLESAPLRPSWLRSPGRLQNTFANEVFMDELAAAAGADPVAFRLQYLKDARGAEVLKAAARRAGWDTQTSPRRPGPAGALTRGRGVAYVQYGTTRTYVAAVAEIEVNRQNGQVMVKKITVAHDCGQIINPDGLLNQIEGNVVQTVSRTIKEEVTFDRSRVTSLDWESYPILTFPEVPQVDVVLLNRPDKPPWGAGEPAGVPIPAAIANAIFDATGVRLRKVPFTPARVKAALEA